MLPSGARKWTQALPLSSSSGSKRISIPAEEFLGRAEDVIDQEAGDGTSGEVTVERTVGTEDLNLAAVGQF